MWITKDERHLLRGYYIELRNLAEQRHYSAESWFTCLNGVIPKSKESIPEYEDQVAPSSTQSPSTLAMRQYLDNLKRLTHANNLLASRELIELTQMKENEFYIKLTLKGYDLGRKYSNWFERSGQWFNEYRNHWIWLFFSFIGGACASLLVDIIHSLLGSMPLTEGAQ